MASTAVVPHWSHRSFHVCVVLYPSFAQAILPISVAAKGILWATFFGLAKALQYSGLAILGVDGYKRLKAKLKR